MGFIDNKSLIKFFSQTINQQNMSHANVTITRTVTTSHPSAIFLNVGYLKSAAGLLKIAELVILLIL